MAFLGKNPHNSFIGYKVTRKKVGCTSLPAPLYIPEAQITSKMSYSTNTSSNSENFVLSLQDKVKLTGLIKKS